MKSPVTKILKISNVLTLKGSHADDTEDGSESAALWQLDKA